MAFLSGPRQVGKTSLAQNQIAHLPRARYLNWDNVSDRVGALQNSLSLSRELLLDHIVAATKTCVIDELHKHAEWRDFLKSIYDSYPDLRLLITGSASLREFSRGGDSLRGRYFPYTLHPLSVAELTHDQPARNTLIHERPIELPDEQWDALLRFGGFPDPFLRAEESFANQWRETWHDQLLREEIRDLTRVQELSQIESLALCIRSQVGGLTNYSALARRIGSSVDTIRRWLEILKSLFYCFSVSPWHKNLSRALRKEPKFYLWDWSQVADTAARFENIVASALLKATQYWTEVGRGRFALHFLRDKEKREVDFLLVRDDQPWLLVEVKSSQRSDLNPHLKYFADRLKVDHAIQVAFDADYHNGDCVNLDRPMIVPARSFLSQLI